MAKTFIGELILRLKDDMSGKAKQAAANIDTSIDKIQAAARKLNNASWGGRFEQQMQKLGASAADLEKLRAAWNRLNADISSRNLSKALAGNERTNFKLAALSEFGAIKSAWDSHADAIEKRTRTMAKRMEMALKPVLVALGGYTGVYMAGVMGREAAIASSSWEREKFRGKMANIPKAEQDRLLNASEKLGGQYSSVSITDIAEMARAARAMMGDTERGLAILPDLVRGMVTLQSAKGTDAAVSELRNLLRGIDNAGKNKDGQLGIDSTREIIAGLIRAAQVEGADINVGQLYQFARRGKIAVPGLSTKFLSNVAPAFMQDMTPEGFGTALSSAYQAFVIGSNAVASKKNIQRQKDIGIRGDKGLVDAKLFGTDPYAWVKSVLVPALQKSGVDMADETAVAQAVAELSRNTNATGLLTRMITQQAQVDRLLEQYGNSMGPDAADQVRQNDPFVAWKGFVESLRNLSAAIGEDTMPTIVAGLNGLADGINTLQQAWRDGDPMAKLGVTAGAGVAAFGAWKLAAAVWGLITAGTSLNAAAVSLQAAAASLGGQGVLGDVDGKKAGPGAKAGLLGLLGRFGGIASLAFLGGDTPDANKDPNFKGKDGLTNRERAGRDWARLQAAEKASALASVHDTIMQRVENDRMLVATGAKRGSVNGVPDRFTQPAEPKVNMSEANSAATEASALGQQIQTALSVSATPQVNNVQLQETLRLVNAIKAGLAGIGGMAASAHRAVSNELNRNFTDQGVTP